MPGSCYTFAVISEAKLKADGNLDKPDKVQAAMVEVALQTLKMLDMMSSDREMFIVICLYVGARAPCFAISRLACLLSVAYDLLPRACTQVRRPGQLWHTDLLQGMCMLEHVHARAGTPRACSRARASG